MSADSEYLIKHGWKVSFQKKQGMFRMRYWFKPPSTEVFAQGVAVQIEKDRQRAKKSGGKKSESTGNQI